MEDYAGWIAPIATMAAAMMTAANLGTRITGWGFVVFTIGSVAWIIVAVATGQTNLLLSNAFLTLVNIVGIWRWLGRRARVDDAAEAVAAECQAAPDTAPLFAATGLVDMNVRDPAGNVVAKAVEAMTDCRTGRIDHLIVSVGGLGGIGEILYRLPWTTVRMQEAGMTTTLDKAAMARLVEARS
jgi:hypothetical protein